jgi:hypothetical protein
MQSDEIIYEIIGNHWKSLETIGKQRQTRMCYLIWSLMISYRIFALISPMNHAMKRLAVVVAVAATCPPVRRYVALTGRRCDVRDDRNSNGLWW